MMVRLGKLLVVVAAVVIGGCATVPRGVPEVASMPVSENTAVAALVNQARVDLESGHRDRASATVERALRIEPRNALLWHELARVRLADGQYPQAEQLAAKSNSFAAENKPLKSANFRLIAEARAARGDSDGARAALDKAAELDN
jgi:Tfp pilus assembly protein PilF